MIVGILRLLPFGFGLLSLSLIGLACATNSGQCFADDVPDTNNEDSNCDGVDGNVANGIFVATTGSDLGDGTMDKPLRSITAALALAQKQKQKTQIMVGVGDYQETKTLNLIDGVGIYGGYDPTNKWSRTTSSKPTTIAGASLAMMARGFKLPMGLGRVTVNAADGAQPSESSFALVAVDVSQMTVDDNCVLQAGKGATGAKVDDGAPGGVGGGGTIGGNGAVDNQGAPGLGGPPGENTACPDANGGIGGKGGSDPNFAGGKGGDSAGGVTGGAGGSNASCSGTNGTAGDTGPNDGTDGKDGTGGAEVGTFDPQTFVYTAANGADGADGTDGAGGGGGGGSSGQTGTLCVDGAGNGGGGGGAGGCGGGKGVGGKGGGASIALIAIRSPISFGKSQLITLGGGSGASGGTGGTGGSPGTGGPPELERLERNRNERQGRRRPRGRTRRRRRRRWRWPELRDLRQRRDADDRPSLVQPRPRRHRRRLAAAPAAKASPALRRTSAPDSVTLGHAADDDVDLVRRVGFDRRARASVELDVRLVRDEIPAALVRRVARDHVRAL